MLQRLLQPLLLGALVAAVGLTVAGPGVGGPARKKPTRPGGLELGCRAVLT